MFEILESWSDPAPLSQIAFRLSCDFLPCAGCIFEACQSQKIQITCMQTVAPPVKHCGSNHIFLFCLAHRPRAARRIYPIQEAMKAYQSLPKLDRINPVFLGDLIARGVLFNLSRRRDSFNRIRILSSRNASSLKNATKIHTSKYSYGSRGFRNLRGMA